MSERNYSVEILEKFGSCESELFEIMAKNGDITSTRVKDMVGETVAITGYAVCRITVNDKVFTIIYFPTKNHGIISTGSEVFKKSVETYYNFTNEFSISEVRTKKGVTYKAVPVLENVQKSLDGEF